MYYLCCSIAVCLLAYMLYFMKTNVVLYKQRDFMMVVLCMLITDVFLLGVTIYRNSTGINVSGLCQYIYIIMLIATLHMYAVTVASYNGLRFINKRVKLPRFYYAGLAAAAVLVVLNIKFDFLFDYRGQELPVSTPAGLVLTAAIYLNCAAAIMYVYSKKGAVKEKMKILAPSVLMISMVFKLIHFSHPDWLFTASADTLIMLCMYIIVDGITDIYNREIGVYNSHAFWSFSKKCESERYPVRMIMIHIENISLLNARLGNYVVDNKIYREIARFLRRESDSSVFYMDNNFFLILIDEDSRLTPLQLAEKISERFHHSWQVNSNTKIVLSMMQGIVNFPDDIESLTRLTDFASALREKKWTEQSSNIIYARNEVFGNRMYTAKVENTIKRAIKDPDIISVWFNPVLSSLDKKLSSAEITSCIEDSELGRISESEFVPVAEKTGLLMALTEKIFEKVCSLFDKYQSMNAAIPFSFISMNVSNILYLHDDLPDTLYGILRRHRLPANFINLQMTEGVVDFTPQILRMNVNSMYKEGFRFTLNHYGNGYFSVKQLLELPFESIQLDRKFLSTVESGSDKAKIAIKGTILTLQQMNLSVIADGVSSPEQAASLNRLGCDHIKGGIISRPLKFDDLMDFVQYCNVRRTAPVSERIGSGRLAEFGNMYDLYSSYKNAEA